MWRTIVDVWTEAMQPESYVGRAYDATVNQWGHAALGLAAIAVFCIGWDVILGEMPYRPLVFAWFVGGWFGLVEIAGQGWRGTDTLDDTYFFAIGAAAPLVSLHEVRTELGHMLDLNNLNGLAIAAVLVISLAFHAWDRART